MMWWNDGMGYGMGWGGWALMILVMVLFWTLVVVGVMALFRTMREDRRTPPDPKRPSGQQILDERFARGEIDAEEYRIRTDQLRTGK
ncbi:SHOCT domain-containing protein [Rhodococcus sp. ABRD24]|uniref:SHOCT domain-containing protein n=1 Tax=Rhodococcus sp. ABRD24 TaxID=2507582 RepID=UPI00103F3332|nr:SHOCT domain-containing protein [Rhodococcus sp. ABRD24]QBJ96016.1 SHOCT domain-containing protein [Rhodococcus sp. ABRD24]